MQIDIANNIYIADTNDHVIRRVDAKTGIIDTVAGDRVGYNFCMSGSCGDGGLATAAQLYSVSAFLIDHQGDIYMADSSLNAIRRVDGVSQQITTVAGQIDFNSNGAFAGDGGSALIARLNSPNGVALDPAGTLFIADSGNRLIRRVDAKTNIITTVAGVTASAVIQQNGCTIAPCGDGGPALDATFNSPSSLAFDDAGNLYMADDEAIRELDTSGTITTVAGTIFSAGFTDNVIATSAQLKSPSGITFDPKNNLYIADSGNSVVRLVTNVGGLIAEPQTITFAPLPDVPQGTGPISLTATASSGLPITYTATGPATISGSTLNLTGVGIVSVTASQPGGPGFAAAMPVTQSFMVIAALGGKMQTITFPPLPPLTYGTAPVQLTASSSAGLLIGYSAAGPAIVTGSLLTITGSGAVSVTASQGGDSTYGTATPVQQTAVVAQAPLTVTAGNATLIAGSQIPTNFSYNFTGFVNGDNQSQVNGAPSFRTTATQNSPVGSYPIVIGAGTLQVPNYSFSFVNGTLTISSLQATTTSIAATPGTAAQGTAVTLTATVMPATGGTPTGTVTFFSGSTQLGVGTLSAGSASFATAMLPSGTDSLSAIYSGDNAFTGSTSAALPIVISGPTFTVSGNSNTLSIPQGQSGTVAVIITPVDNYTGSILFDCGQAPAGVSCSFAPNRLIVSGTAPSQGTLTINTSGLAALRRTNARPFWFPNLPLDGGALTLACMFFGFARRKDRAFKSLYPALVLLVALGAPALLGCGAAGGSAQAKTGQFTLTVTATDPVLQIAQSFQCVVTVK